MLPKSSPGPVAPAPGAHPLPVCARARLDAPRERPARPAASGVCLRASRVHGPSTPRPASAPPPSPWPSDAARVDRPHRVRSSTCGWAIELFPPSGVCGGNYFRKPAERPWSWALNPHARQRPEAKAGPHAARGAWGTREKPRRLEPWPPRLFVRVPGRRLRPPTLSFSTGQKGCDGVSWSPSRLPAAPPPASAGPCVPANVGLVTA